MYKVTLTKACGCVKKANMPMSKEFEDKEFALKEATEWSNEMNDTFCQKHNFKVQDNGSNEILIEVELNSK
jgi:hypothetical protein